MKGEIIYPTIALTTLGSTAGALIATVNSQSIVAYSTMMGANYLTISLPFFTARAALLAIPYENKLKNKDRDQMIASVVSGCTIGASLSYYTSNPLLHNCCIILY